MAKPFKINDLLMRVRYALEEARVDLDACMEGDYDNILSSLSNPLRRRIIRILALNVSVRLGVIAKELDTEDHTKIIFHLKILKEACIVEQGSDKTYSLTDEGYKALESMKIFENYMKNRSLQNG